MKILVVRTSAMGDIIHSLPVLTALRRALPEARIGWVVEQHFSALLDDHPWVDEVFPVRLRPWRRRPFDPGVWREAGSALRRIRAFRADLALDLMGNHKGALVARFSGARRVIGAARADRREGSSALWIHQGVPTPGRHAIDRSLDLLTPLGIAPGPVDFAGQHLLPTPTPEAEDFLARQHRPYVVIQAGAGWANKTYPAERWGAVARALRSDPGVEVYVPLAPGEEHLAQAVVAASDGAARTVDARAFAFLAALLRHSQLVLGGDTGPIHLARALDTPVLCLVGPTDPDRNGPYATPQQVLFEPLPCSFCYKRFDEPKACLLAFHPDRVVAHARKLIGIRERTSLCARPHSPPDV